MKYSIPYLNYYIHLCNNLRVMSTVVHWGLFIGLIFLSLWLLPKVNHFAKVKRNHINGLYAVSIFVVITLICSYALFSYNPKTISAEPVRVAEYDRTIVHHSHKKFIKLPKVHWYNKNFPYIRIGHMF